MDDGYLTKQNSELFRVRNRLKSQLVADPKRTRFTTDGYKPFCAYCNEVMSFVIPDMHEVFITRGDIMGMELDPSLIFVRFNCVLITPTCHKQASTMLGQDRCRKHLIDVEGKDPIIAWLKSVLPFFRSQAEILASIRFLEEGIYLRSFDEKEC